MASSEHTKRRVCYYYDTCVGNYYYGQGHVMKPHRIKMAHSLVLNYGLYRHMEIFRPFPATYNDLVRFHTEDYVNFLRDCTPQNLKLFNRQTIKFNADEDCPIFDGLYEFCQISSGGSLAAAVKLNKRKTDIAINWMGGLHHAKKSESSGFCYTNDIVLGILELLKHHERVLYIDIDVHHGDGVEEAFYTTDRVMTCSFHRYGDFFPGTGNITDVGMGQGERYAVNVPLSDGITDDAYKSIFEPVIARIMETYRPSAVVLQCGADSLNGDRLGNFNMTLRGHGNCVRYLRSFNVPLMLVGGGGYTARNVARCWTYETALAVNQEISNTLPHNDYFEFYQPSFKLHIDPQIGLRDENAKDTLEKLQQAVFENLRQLPHVPSVQMQSLKPDAVNVEEVENICLESSNPDERLTEVETDKMIEDPGELYDGEKEGGGRNEQSSKPAKRIRLAAASFPTVLTVSSEDEMEVDATDDNNSPVEPHAIMKEDENANSTQEKLPKTIVETLSVQMQALTPVNAVNVKMAEESSIPNERPTQAKSAKVIVDLGELYDGEKEGGGRNEQQSSKPAKRTAASFPPLFTISDSEDAMEVDGNNSPVEPQAVMKDQNAKDTHDKSPKTVVETLSIQMQALQPMNAVSVKKAEESSNPNKRLTKKAGGGGRNEQPSKRPKRSGKTLRAVLREIARRVENGLTSSDSSEDEMDVDVTGDNGSHGGVRK